MAAVKSLRNEGPASEPPTLYSGDVEAIREREYPMLKNATYLDHAGTTLYPMSSIEAFSQDMMSSLYGNPHAASMSSQLSTKRIDDIRLRVLRFFKANQLQFDLVFVANATAGIKLVMEAFRDQEHGFWFDYHKDCHTSLVGVREAARAGHRCFKSDVEVEAWLHDPARLVLPPTGRATRLFAYPAQSNMDGRQLPTDWFSRLRSNPALNNTYCLLDAAALASTSPLDLSNYDLAPDYTIVSFSKIFGFPDLGAVIVRRDAEGPLQTRRYFGGGTVDMVTCGQENWHIKKQTALHAQLEDGTLPIHSILALDHALDAHLRLYGSQERIATHTGSLAQKLYDQLAGFQHFNRNKVCEIYSQRVSEPGGGGQGPVIAFNIRNAKGGFVSNAEVEKLAIIQSIHIRSGGLCNPGGVSSALHLAPWELQRNFSAGHRCGDDNDVIDGKPTGVLRASLGAMSTLQDVKAFLGFISEYFIETHPPESVQPFHNAGFGHLYIEDLFVYPVKSCAGFRIPSTADWVIQAEGLAWDREWCIVHQGTRKTLSQKDHPRMALLRSDLDFQNGVLKVRFTGYLHRSIDDEIVVPLSADPRVYEEPSESSDPVPYKVCGDSVQMKTYASQDIAEFLTSALGTPCTLARFASSSSGHSLRHAKVHLSKPGRPHSLSLANESPILVITRSSLNALNERIKLTSGKAAHASVFRANIILREDLTQSPGHEQPFAEDDWQSLQIDEKMSLDVLGGCRRCQMVCIDQNTAEKNVEPFATLAKTRRKQGKAYFGVHAALSADPAGQRSTIKVGDAVQAIMKQIPSG